MTVKLPPDLELIKGLARPSSSKIVMLVIDGMGGLPHPDTGKTELDTARTPNLDHLAAASVCGLVDPVAPGITPGSAPGHLALFGYDPLCFTIGRGVLEALGIDAELGPQDIAVRGNFCSVNDVGLVTDRRAGRIPTDECARLCRLLDGWEYKGVKVQVLPVREHRFVAIFRGEGLEDGISDSDPQQGGAAPFPITTLDKKSVRTADIAARFITHVANTLAGERPANMALLRGFSRRPQFPTMSEVYKLKAAAIAVYPMYRGLARLVGMDVLDTESDFKGEIATLKQAYADYDFFFLHAKWTDSAGEDGDFERKVSVIEEIDTALEGIAVLKPDVIAVVGDHSTPALLKGHSWHPLPVLLYSKWCRPDMVSRFSESPCIGGGLGRMPATRLMALAMANALKLAKFGA